MSTQQCSSSSFIKLYFIALFLFFNGCKALPLEPSITDHYTPEVLTIILKITPTENDSLPKIELDQKIIANGFLKKNTIKNPKIKENSIIATFYDKQGNSKQKMIFDYPLEQSFEYTDEKGNFLRKTIVLEDAFLPIRVQHSSSIHTLKVYYIYQQEQLLLKTILLQ